MILWSLFFRKSKQPCPLNQKKFIKNAEQTLQLGIKPYKQCSKFKETINRVNDAAINKKSVEIVYYTMSRKKESIRKVDPYKIWFFNSTFYLIGHCHVRDEVRIFALDRIKMLHQTKDTFEVPEDFSFEEFIGSSFGVFKGEAVHVKVWFSPEIAGYIKEKIWHESQEIKDQDDGSIIFEVKVAGTEEIKFWIMNWGSQALVLEPDSLRNEIKAEAELMVEKYTEGVVKGEKPQIA